MKNILQTTNHSLYHNFFTKVNREIDRQFKIASSQLSSCLPEAFLKQVHPELSGYIKDLKSAGILACMPGIDTNASIDFMVSFKLVSFCLDFLCESREMNDETIVNQLYQPLYDSIDFEREPDRYDEYYFNKPLGVFIKRRVESCRKQIASLPSYKLTIGKMKKYIQLYIGLQSCKNQPMKLRSEKLCSWSNYYIRQFPDISLQEFAASADSLLGVYVMFLAAKKPDLTEDEVKAMDSAYLPWICAYHKLLQNYTTAREDLMTGKINFTDYYNTLKLCEQRLIFLLSKSLDFCTCLDNSEYHSSLVKLITAIYLTDPRAQFGLNRIASQNILESAPFDTRMLIFFCRLLGICKY